MKSITLQNMQKLNKSQYFPNTLDNCLFSKPVLLHSYVSTPPNVTRGKTKGRLLSLLLLLKIIA